MTLFRSHQSTFTLALVLALMLGFGVGCDRSSTPPTPLPAAEFPAAFDKAFSKSRPEVRELAQQIVAAVQAQEYSKAFDGLQSFAGRADLASEQISVLSRARATVNTLLQEAEAKGDPKAAETLRVYHSTK